MKAFSSIQQQRGVKRCLLYDYSNVSAKVDHIDKISIQCCAMVSSGKTIKGFQKDTLIHTYTADKRKRAILSCYIPSWRRYLARSINNLVWFPINTNRVCSVHINKLINATSSLNVSDFITAVLIIFIANSKIVTKAKNVVHVPYCNQLFLNNLLGASSKKCPH